jgi:hypothetical protein
LEKEGRWHSSPGAAWETRFWGLAASAECRAGVDNCAAETILVPDG